MDVLSKLENAGHRLSENKSELFKTEKGWIGIDQNGIDQSRPNRNPTVTRQITRDQRYKRTQKQKKN